MSSNIRLFVSFGDRGAVFAGEKLECTITFKNVTQTHSNAISLNGGNSSPLFSERRSKQPPLQLVGADKSVRSAHASPRLPPAASGGGGAAATANGGGGGGANGKGKSHRPSLSLSMPSSSRRSQSTGMGNMTMISGTTTPMTTRSGTNTPNENGKHMRSVSIVSIGSNQDANENGINSPARRPKPPHSRSTSLHLLPRRSPGVGPNGSTPNSATLRSAHSPHPSTATHIIEDSLSGFAFPSPKRSPGTPRHAASGSFNKSFKFPSNPSTPAAETPPPPPSAKKGRQKSIGPSSSESLLGAGITNVDLVSPADESNSEFEFAPPSRAVSNHQLSEETPRSSAEFYRFSNGNADTITSNGSRSPRLNKPTHSRRQSLLSMVMSPNRPTFSDNLMMGYAQILGSFTIDGSLVQSSAFDEVKRKGVVSGQMGGGVVGIDRGRNSDGLFGGLGWSSIGSGLTGFLGGGNMSSIQEMKNIASSKSIPLLSTPQSILFIDMKLAPGESKSYTYTFSLPRGLPPSHKGKAIKVVYNLVIGAQRPGKGEKPKVIEIPFRVFPHVNGYGNMHSHDLMSPIILLKDEAITTSLDDKKKPKKTGPPKPMKEKDDATLEDFLQYVDKLLAQRNSEFSPNPMGLLSPSAASSRRASFIIPEEPTAKQAIDFAVLGAATGKGTSRVYEIARSGKRVASLTLGRPAYKLGDSVLALVDFTGAQIPCYQLNATLETHEKVDSSIALRSASSISRVTRRIHAQQSESCLYAKRVNFVPTIPITATPEFNTSGVSCSWSIRLEFITPVLPHHRRPSELDLDDMKKHFIDLLEQSHKDDRGQLFTATQQLSCDTFDCNIPVKVFANEIGAGGNINPPGGFVV